MAENATALEEKIAALEEDVKSKREMITELRRQIPREAVADYTLKNAANEDVKLSEIFGDKNDLIVIHNMGKSCPYCTLWADGFNGELAHMENRAAVALVSPDSPETQREFADSRGWKFTMYSGKESTFIADMGFSMVQSGATYQLPGVSTFHKNDDGSISRVAKDFFGPGDLYSGIWHIFNLLDEGANNWQPKYSYN